MCNAITFLSNVADLWEYVKESEVGTRNLFLGPQLQIRTAIPQLFQTILLCNCSNSAIAIFSNSSLSVFGCLSRAQTPA
jgi:hypothetical protein